MESSLYLLITFSELTNNWTVKESKKDGSLEEQLIDIQHYFFNNLIFNSCNTLNGFLESIITEKQIFQKRQAAEFEQLSAIYTSKHVLELLQKLQKMNIKKELINQIIKQCFIYISIHSIELLLQNDSLMTSAKGFQFKFFFSILDSEMLQIKELNQFRNYILIGVEASGLLLLDHSDEHFDYKVLKNMLPHLTGNLIYEILSRFKTDQINPQPISKNVI